jgi:hypothetical protein
VNSVFDGDFDGVRPNDQGGFFDPDPIGDFAAGNHHTPNLGNEIGLFVAKFQCFKKL